MTVLDDVQRRTLDRAVQYARAVAEAAAREAVSRLAVDREARPDYLSTAENDLRLALREKARLLGDSTGRGADLPMLIGDIAYEQWHRLLFARFLEVNRLLRHPDVPDVALTMEDCAELAADEGEPDAWSVAARYAEAILPGVFRSADPAVRIRFSPERRAELDAIVAGLDRDTLAAEDALGWVYQFWQTAEKKRVNDSGRKIGGADLAPVTQLFTENYMVRFLLENSLGAWWAGRHPDSPLLKEWEYLRYLDDGTPAAGTFDDWPTRPAEVTVMDPCCGSGHFLVAAFGMLWRMRIEEEGLSDAEAQDAVLRDNLFGLELDPRCTQIAVFNVILEAWKRGGFRELPTPQVACSGISIKASREDWEKQVQATPDLRPAMARLHTLFRHGDSLGSLIDPTLAPGDALLSAHGTSADTWSSVRREVLALIRSDRGVPGAVRSATEDLSQAVLLLARCYSLVVTNPPYLQRQSMDDILRDYVDHEHPLAKADVAAAFIERAYALTAPSGATALVSPQNWALLRTYRNFRQRLLAMQEIGFVARLGSGAFRQISGEVVKVTLSIFRSREPRADHRGSWLQLQRITGADKKALELQYGRLEQVTQTSQARNPDCRITGTVIAPEDILEVLASGLNGTTTGDYAHYGRTFWEVLDHVKWQNQQSTVTRTQPYGGREHVILWSGGSGPMQADPGATIRGKAALGKRGVAVSQMGDLLVTLYTGEHFDNNTAVILPARDNDLPAIWTYCSSREYGQDVRDIDDSLKVTNATLVKIPFDRERWQRVAEENCPLPQPHSDDPTQWLFKGTIPDATEPLHVAVARLLGYRWPDQEPDHLHDLADTDGIVALPALTGEFDAATRLRTLLARAYGDDWSTQREQTLIQQACGKRIGLDAWLRDEFFKQHTKLFHHRPFLWHVWDGRKDGFAAIVNYHHLDRRVLEKLTFTVLGTWIDRQRTDAGNDVAGADLRLAAALDLRRRLELILAGEAPYDIYVRWKSLAEQPIGWEPDLDDGVRLNIRPFVTAEVLRSKVNVSWKKDRGTNPDGTERHNDLHPSLAERRAARAAVEVSR